MKEEILELLKSTNRDGMDELIDFLENKTGFVSKFFNILFFSFSSIPSKIFIFFI